MNYLLDTHALLWWLFDDPHLSQTARGLIADPDNRVWVSSASAWEIATKHRIGKLSQVEVLVRNIPEWIDKAGFHELPITVRHAQKAGSWQVAHRDPFDRVLAAQSALEDAPLVSTDGAFAAFGIHRIW